MEQKQPKINDDKDELYFDCKDKKWISGRIIDCSCRKYSGVMHKGNPACKICGNILYKHEKGDFK